MTEEEERLAAELAKVRAKLKREEQNDKRAAKLRSAALRWLIVPGFLVFGLWFPLSDAPAWAQSLGFGLGGLIAYVVYTVERLKTQLNAIGEITYQNWERAGGPYHPDD
ncbi:hypothetical protein [Phenylobacterium sp.]|uniref:hypothetical protein n=1 Tax=Phenylobacterium sp. TaxID=1871053 RepID=UPI00394EBB05